jgi:hypothetical protein
MSMVHHDSRPYAVAAVEARNKALDIINKKIELGRTNAARVIEHVNTAIPQDYIHRDSKMEFMSDDGLGLRVQFNSRNFGFHKNALAQASAKASIPLKYVETLREEKQLDLLAHNFNKRFSKSEDSSLLRVLDNDVRGFLSDRYKRIDARPVIDAFTAALHKVGAQPYDGIVTDTRGSIHAIDMNVYEPVPNEVIAFVYALTWSDFGRGAVEFSQSVLRMWCTNLAMGESLMRKIHIGRKLDERKIYSAATQQLDAKTTISALGDVVKFALTDNSKLVYLNAVKEAHESKLDPWKAKDLLQKQLGKEDASKVIEAFNSPDVELLPAGNTKWRMSNAISWLAGKEEDADKKLDMMEVAGKWAGLGQLVTEAASAA